MTNIVCWYNSCYFVTRLKQINDKRERAAAKEAEVIEKGEKWKHQKQEKGKKQNPKDTWKKKVQYNCL
jgi:hypothetical protein